MNHFLSHKLISVLLLWLVAIVCPSLVHATVSNHDLLSSEQAFRLSASPEGNRIKLSWSIAPGYYLYRDKFKFAVITPGVVLDDIQFPPGETKHDEFFGEMVIYRGDLSLYLKLKERPISTSTIDFNVSVQGCADVGVCYPPFKQKMTVTLESDTSASASSFAPSKFTAAFKLPGRNRNAGSNDLLPAEEAFRFLAEMKDANSITVSWRIADGYYLYRDKFKFNLPESLSGVQLGSYSAPRGEVHQDPEFGEVEILRGDISFNLPLLRTGIPDSAITAFTLQASFQGCADRGVCYPPMQQSVKLDLPPQLPSNFPVITKVAEQDRIAAALSQDSIFVTVLSFLGFGVLLSFTPCVFPMIPILSGIIVGHGHTITASRGFLLSLSYVVASALTYTVFGVLAGIFGSNLQAIFQEPSIIFSFSVVFVLLALSMFDLYTFQMPSFIQNHLTGWSQRQGGGTLMSSAIMGALSALIVGPCVAAPLAGALIYIGQTGDALLGGLALFSLGMGMGLPLLAIGASAGKLLPRAGLWMNVVKSFFGVGLLAVAIWLMGRILPPSLILFLWALLLIIPSVYLGALDSLPHPCSGWRKFFKGVGIVMLIYGIFLLIGVASNHTDPLRPLESQTSGSTVITKSPSIQGLPFRPVSTVSDVLKELDKAASNGQWVMLDFYADWCVSCKELEHYTFTDHKVQKALDKTILLRADVTQNSEDDQLLLRRFGLIGPPAILFFGPDKEERKGFRVIGFMNADEFLGHVEMVIQSCVQTC